jgi:hypothetical protein
MTSFKTVMDSNLMSEKKSKDEAYNALSSILVDNGLDIKMGNKDIGLITTEYKKFGAFGSDPPFDLYLQIKLRVNEIPNSGKLKIVATPLAKEVNRLNAGAFTEKPLRFFDEEAKKGYLTDKEKAYLAGFLLYSNVLHAITETFGLGMEDIQNTIQQQSEPI